MADLYDEETRELCRTQADKGTEYHRCALEQAGVPEDKAEAAAAELMAALRRGSC